MRVTCPNCGGNHPKWECKAPATKSTGAKARASSNQRGSQVAQTVEPGLQAVMARDPKAAGAIPALPVDTKPKRGRPISDAPKSPRAEYQRELMRKRRAEQKAKP